MATQKKTKPAAKVQSRSSFDRFERIGAVRGSTRSLPAFNPAELVLPCDKEHPAYATHEPYRYALDNPDIQREMKTIEAAQGKLLQTPTGSTLVGRDEGLVFVKDGGRRCAALRYLNRERKAHREAEFLVHVEITFGETVERFMEAHAITNLRRVNDDPVTLAKKIRQRLLGDDAQGLEPISIPQACEMFEVDEKYLSRIMNERTGLLALSSAWQQAVARGAVPEAAALTAATLTKDEDDEGARHAAQDALWGQLEATGKADKATPATLKALVRGEQPQAKAKPKALTAKDRAALGQLLDLFRPGRGALSAADRERILAAADLSGEDVDALRVKLPLVVGGTGR